MGNDLFGAPFPLGGVVVRFARARNRKVCRRLAVDYRRRNGDSGESNEKLPLLLPWAIALVASWRLPGRRPLAIGHGLYLLRCLASLFPRHFLTSGIAAIGWA